MTATSTPVTTTVLHETDVVIIGAGPVGLFAIFECGMMNLSTHVVDVLPHVGGQCAALYPEKPIYDIPGYPVISGRELIDKLMEQAAPFAPTFHLGRQVTGLQRDPDTETFMLSTSRGFSLRCKAIILAAGVGAFGPNRPPLKDIGVYEDAPEGAGVAYSVRDPHNFADRSVVIAGGGDSAIDWANALAPIAQRIYVVHRRPKFRATPDSLSQLDHHVTSGKVSIVTPYQLQGLEGDPATKKLSAVKVATLDGEVKTLPADALLAFFGLSMDLGPINAWGLGVQKHQVQVSPATMESTLGGVFAIGDVAGYDGKLKLILTGFAEAALAAKGCYGLVHPGQAYHFEYSTTRGVPSLGTAPR